MGNKGNRTTETSTNPGPLKDALTFLAETIVHRAAERSRSDPGRIKESGLFCDPQLLSLTDLIQLILPIAKFNHYIGCGVH